MHDSSGATAQDCRLISSFEDPDFHIPFGIPLTHVFIDDEIVPIMPFRNSEFEFPVLRRKEHRKWCWIIVGTKNKGSKFELYPSKVHFIGKIYDFYNSKLFTKGER